MSRKLVVRPQAEREAEDAAAWYFERSPDATAQFNQALAAAFERIVENPFLYQVIDYDIHRVPLVPFPYGLLYSVTEDEIIVLSCFHDSRNPDRWRERLE